MAGSVYESVKKQLSCKCGECNLSFVSSATDSPDPSKTKLIRRKNLTFHNKLNTPSDSVLRIAECCESAFNKISRYRTDYEDAATEKLKLPSKRDLRQLKECLQLKFKGDPTLFRKLQNKSSDLPRHCSTSVSEMVKFVIQEYLKVRKFDFGREFKRVHILNNKPSKRHKMLKILHYTNV